MLSQHVDSPKKIASLWRRSITALMALVFAVSFAVSTITPTYAASTQATVTRERWVTSRMLDITVSSPSIDAWTKTIRILVPQGWSKTATRTWPTLWMLHGGGGNHEDWTKNTDIEEQVANKDVIVVMPETSWCSAYSNWYNGGKWGKPAWETFVMTEVRELLENKYRANSTDRAIAGLSMGGLGSMKFAANHNDKFQAAASFSGNVDPLHSFDNQATEPNLPGLSCGADWKRVWGDYKIAAQKAIWQANNPYDQAHKLVSMKYLYVSSGNGLGNPLNSGMFFGQDPVEVGVYPQNVAFVSKLEGLGAPVTSHFYEGTHSWPYWQREMHQALPGLLNAINVE